MLSSFDLLSIPLTKNPRREQFDRDLDAAQRLSTQGDRDAFIASLARRYAWESHDGYNDKEDTRLRVKRMALSLVQEQVEKGLASDFAKQLISGSVF